MRPHIIAHMEISLDGRIAVSRWRDAIPGLSLDQILDTYEDIHRQLGGDAWIVGRKTMAEIAEGSEGFNGTGATFPRTTFKGAEVDGKYAIAVDPHGRVHWSRNTANGDAVIEVLTEQVSDEYLEELRSLGISYLFAGATEISLDEMLSKLRAEFGIERLLLEGGGGVNGTFLAHGLVDELSLMIIPVLDGFSGAPSVFYHDAAASVPTGMLLDTMERLEGGMIRLKYRRHPDAK